MSATNIQAQIQELKRIIEQREERILQLEIENRLLITRLHSQQEEINFQFIV